MDEVLDDPITLSYGKQENELIITIDSKAGLEFTWAKETYSKLFWDTFEKGKEILRTIIEAIAAALRYIVDRIGWTKQSALSENSLIQS